MKASIKTLMEEFTATSFETDELEYLDMFQLKTLLPFLANEKLKSDVENNFQDS